MAGFGLCRWSENRLGKLISLQQSGGKCDPTDCLADLVLFPAGASQVPAHDAFDRHDFGFLNHHAATLQRFDIGSIGEGQSRRVEAQNMIRYVESIEPEAADLSEDSSLVGNSIRQNPVECTDPVRRDEQ